MIPDNTITDYKSTYSMIGSMLGTVSQIIGVYVAGVTSVGIRVLI